MKKKHTPIYVILLLCIVFVAAAALTESVIADSYAANQEAMAEIERMDAMTAQAYKWDVMTTVKPVIVLCVSLVSIMATTAVGSVTYAVAKEARNRVTVQAVGKNANLAVVGGVVYKLSATGEQLRLDDKRLIDDSLQAQYAIEALPEYSKQAVLIGGKQ